MSEIFTPDPNRLGRIHRPDPRDAAYPMRSLLATPLALPPRKLWRPGAVLDQGQTPACVGFGWRGFLDCGPLVNHGGPAPLDLYHQAQVLDEEPGESYDGTTVRAGAKAISADGFITAYHWASDEPTVRAFVLTQGPVVLGTDWTEQMFTPGADGFVTVAGAVVGGHCYLCTGYDSARQAYRCRNSWGRTWGQAGNFWLRQADLATLLADQGESCTAVEARVTRKQTVGNSDALG